jgi:hypothetical protein
MADINQSPSVPYGTADISILRRARHLWSRELTNHEHEHEHELEPAAALMIALTGPSSQVPLPEDVTLP